MLGHEPMDILKEAILLERRGRSFYLKVAEQSAHAAVREFFEMMAEEEQRHIEILEDQFSAYARNQQFEPLASQERQNQPADQLVLDESVKKQIAAADYEAAAISAAILMEEKAVALYSERAEVAQDPAEESLYLWLAAWERGHLSSLVKIDREIKEAIWNDQQFWPF
ncbi:MAG: ferritin family protein [Desulfobacteraceae bacterium]|jgi:rubrerythrin